jgi:hypothetical protein
MVDEEKNKHLLSIDHFHARHLDVLDPQTIFLVC